MTLQKKPPMVWRTFFLCVIISLGQLVGAYESVIIGTTLQKKDFMVRMGLWDHAGKHTDHYNSRVGAIVGLFQAGSVFGVILAAIVMDRWGRKAGLILGSILSLPALAGMTGSMNIPEFLVFRFIAGMGTWACGCAASVLIPELAPPAYRGFFSGMNGVTIGLGVTFASYVGMGFYFVDSPVVAWRAPMGIPLIGPLLILCSIAFLPESPRFLLLKERSEQARRIFDKLNTSSSTDDASLNEEFNQMELQAAHDRAMDSSWKSLVTNPVYRKRIFLACVITALNQSTGVLVINNYGQTFYQTLGFSPTDRQLFQGNRDTIALFGNILGSYIIDYVGRRAILLFALAGCCLCVSLEAIMVALYAHTDNSSGKAAGVAMLYLFLASYATGIDVGTYVYLGEMFPTHVRVKGVAIALASLNVTATIYLSTTSYAFSDLGWKYFLVFAVITFCGVVWVALVIPETKRVPLEEIEASFGNQEATTVFISEENRKRYAHEGEDKTVNVGTAECIEG